MIYHSPKGTNAGESKKSWIRLRQPRFNPVVERKLQTHRGKVFLVGAGPGDADLITVKAAHCLQSADVVLYDRLINRQLLNYTVDAELIYIGKRAGGLSTRQQNIEQLLIHHALKGKIVVRLK